MNPGDSTVHSDRVIETRVSLAAAILVGVLIFGIGLFFIMGQSNDWTAKSTAVVLPEATVPRDSAPSYYDTLSQGQIVETYAEMLRLQRFKDDSVKALKLGAAGDSVTVTVAVVPNTALLTVTASGQNAETAEKLADSVLALATQYVSTLPSPYAIARVGRAEGTATQPPSNTTTLLIALFIVSLVIAFATYQGVSQLLLLRQRRSSNESADTDDGSSADDTPVQERVTARRTMDWPRRREPDAPAPVPVSSWPRRPGESSSADS